MSKLNVVYRHSDSEGRSGILQTHPDVILESVPYRRKFHDIPWFAFQPEPVELVEQVTVKLMEQSYRWQAFGRVVYVGLRAAVFEHLPGQAREVYAHDGEAVAVHRVVGMREDVLSGDFEFRGEE